MYKFFGAKILYSCTILFGKCSGNNATFRTLGVFASSGERMKRHLVSCGKQKAAQTLGEVVGMGVGWAISVVPTSM